MSVYQPDPVSTAQYKEAYEKWLIACQASRQKQMAKVIHLTHAICSLFDAYFAGRILKIFPAHVSKT